MLLTPTPPQGLVYKTRIARGTLRADPYGSNGSVYTQMIYQHRIHALIPTTHRLPHVQHAHAHEIGPLHGRVYREIQSDAYHETPRHRRTATLCTRRVHNMDATSCKPHARAKTFDIMLTCACRTSFSAFRAPCQHGASGSGGRAQVSARVGRPRPSRASPRCIGRRWDLHLVSWKIRRRSCTSARSACKKGGPPCSGSGLEPRRAAADRRARSTGNYCERGGGRRRLRGLSLGPAP